MQIMPMLLSFLERHKPPVGPPPGGLTWEEHCRKLADEDVDLPPDLTLCEFHDFIIEHPVWYISHFLMLRGEGDGWK